MVTADIALLRGLIAVLRAGGIEDAELEAKWILEDAETAEQAWETAQRRAAHEPLQYLLGKWEFYGLTLTVGRGVLIPRADTETLVEAVLTRLRGTTAPRIADLCTGSGCIALALKSQRADASVCGVELSTEALGYAAENRSLLGLEVQLVQADVLKAQTAAQLHGLDCIVCNPPYLTAEDMQHLQQEVQYEPASALDGGTDGLHFYREIARLWRDALKQGGILAFEVGIYQADAVSAILRENGFVCIEAVRDLNGIERAVIGTKE